VALQLALPNFLVLVGHAVGVRRRTTGGLRQRIELTLHARGTAILDREVLVGEFERLGLEDVHLELGCLELVLLVTDRQLHLEPLQVEGQLRGERLGEARAGFDVEGQGLIGARRGEQCEGEEEEMFHGVAEFWHGDSASTTPRSIDRHSWDPRSLEPRGPASSFQGFANSPRAWPWNHRRRPSR
jgi:hypothetical protein